MRSVVGGGERQIGIEFEKEAAKQNNDGWYVKFKPLANIVVHSPIYTQAMKQISTSNPMMLGYSPNLAISLSCAVESTEEKAR